MMGGDWRDALSALSGSLPEGEEMVTPSDDPKPSGTKSVTLFFERKGRAGKPATILGDFTGTDDAEIEALGSELKRKLGTGGSVRGGEILIQGDRREELRTILKSKGFRVKG